VLQFLFEISVLVAWYWDQPDRGKARWRLFLVFLLLVLVGALGYAGFNYGWPWVHTHWMKH
jgi:hypothetical protein